MTLHVYDILFGFSWQELSGRDLPSGSLRGLRRPSRLGDPDSWSSWLGIHHGVVETAGSHQNLILTTILYYFILLYVIIITIKLLNVFVLVMRKETWAEAREHPDGP